MHTPMRGDMAEHVELLGSVNETENRAAPLLAICIPTLNRRIALEECLESVLPQADALGVGVCVSDNSSSDDTWQALETLKRQYPWMQIMHHTRDIGYRDNLTGVVLSSHAHYVWPIGDKYVLLPGALEYVMSVLVHLHPDVVVVSSPDTVVKTGEKTYSAPQSCLVEIGGHTTLLGATVLPRQAFIDVLHVQPLSRVFPQVVDLFSYLASLSAPQVLFSGRVLIQLGKSAIEDYGVSPYAYRTLEVWGRNWYDAVMSLPALYSANDKLQAVTKFWKWTGFWRLGNLVRLRVQGQLTLQQVNADQVSLRAAVSIPWCWVVIISVVPRWILWPVLYVHPQLMLRAMRRRLRFRRGQQAHRSAQ